MWKEEKELEGRNNEKNIDCKKLCCHSRKARQDTYVALARGYLLHSIDRSSVLTNMKKKKKKRVLNR